MLRGINHQLIFEDDEDREKFLDTIKKYKQKSGYKLFGYCLMDNHIHLLIQEGREPLENTMKRIGVSYVFWYNFKHERSGHLFQDRFKSEPVEDDGYLLMVLKYISQNPKQAGLVKDLANYKWNSYYEYINGARIIDQDFVLGIFANNKQQLKDFLDGYAAEGDEKVLDIKTNKRFTDEVAKKIIQAVLDKVSLRELKHTGKDERDGVLRKLREIDGLSIRQIARITGFSINIVAKAK